jgi:hypothetical protein
MNNTIKGYGAPTLSTVGDAGQRYIDLDTGKEYICTGFQTDTIYEEDNIEPHSYISTNFHKGTVSGYEWVAVGGGGSKKYILTADDFVYGGGSNYFVNEELFDAILAGECPEIWILEVPEHDLDGQQVMITTTEKPSEKCIHMYGPYMNYQNGTLCAATAGVFRTDEDWQEYARKNELL